MSYERLTADNSAVLFIDHQTGLATGIQDQSVPEFTIAVTALAKIAKVFKLPSVITTSAANGPNVPVLPILPELLPDAPVIHRPGEINACDNANFTAIPRDNFKRIKQRTITCVWS